jgi:oxygen-independent coproporphyrinogen-3 oxidase
MAAFTAETCRKIRESGNGERVDTIYFGGGTPSLIGAANIVHILAALRGAYNVAADAEITLEANPGDICLRPRDGGAGMLPALAIIFAAGVNRLSFGVQSSDAAELATLGRRHSFADAAAAVNAARRVGFDNITLDLMYGLPGQRMDTWRQSVGDIIALEPEHISCYMLKLEPGTQLYSRRDELPEDELCLEMYLHAVETLENEGYSQYEISNFARDGRQSRHNTKYWTDAPYLGFGAAAHSYADGVRWENKPDGTVERVTLTERDRLEERIMLSLRQTRGLDIGVLPEGMRSATVAFMQKCVGAGLARRTEHGFALTVQGMFVSNSVISEIFGMMD